MHLAPTFDMDSSAVHVIVDINHKVDLFMGYRTCAVNQHP